MPSKESEALGDLFASLSKRMYGHQEAFTDSENRRALFEVLESLASEPTDVTYADVKCPGTVRPAIWATPMDCKKDAAILYFHGGGFVTGSPSSHRKLAAHLAKAAGIPALIIDYRKGLEHLFPAAVEDCATAYKWLLEEKHLSSGRIAFAGDSAGGNLATTAVLQARDWKLPLPGAVVGFSPWYDLNLEGETIKTNKEKDKLSTNPEQLIQLIQFYLSGAEGATPTTPLFNPLYADLKGFPPTFLTAGTYESLGDNPRMFQTAAKKQGVDSIAVDEVEGMQHVHVFMAGRAPEADKSIQDAGKFLRKHLGI